jgi:hypothetical protein
MNTVQRMAEEIRAELAQGVEIDDIKDRSGEIVDGFLPVYTNEIIKEWQEMPSAYDDRGGQELGTDGSIGIVGLMSLDLYLYYTDLFNEALEEVEESIEEELCDECGAPHEDDVKVLA